MWTHGRWLIPLVLMAALPGLGAPAIAQTAQPNLSYSFHVGSTEPLGAFDSLSDANVHLDIDFTYRFGDLTYLKQHWNAKLFLGMNQFTAESFAGFEHPRWINLSADLQLVTAPTSTGLRGYIQAGVGVYKPTTGSTLGGFNAGIGLQVPLGGVFALEFGVDLHQIQTHDPTRFATAQLGVLFR